MPVTLYAVLSGLMGAACGGGAALTPREQTAIDQMKRALDAARAAQERFYASEGHYTNDPERLDIADIPGQTALVLEEASIAGYVVSATHPSTDWICFLVQPPNRPFYTRCERGGDAGEARGDERQLTGDDRQLDSSRPRPLLRLASGPS